MPITWKNVNAPSLKGVAALSEVGGRSVDRGINRLQDSLASVNKRDRQNTQANVDDYINSFKDEASFNRARSEGLLTNDALSGKFGSNYDRSATNAVVESRLGEIRDRLIADDQYTQTTEDIADRAKNEEINAAILLANGDEAQLAKVGEGIQRAGLNNPNPAMAAFQEAVNTSKRQTIADQDRAQQLADADTRRVNAATLFSQNQEDRAQRIEDKRLDDIREVDARLTREEMAIQEADLAEYRRRNPGVEVTDPNSPEEKAAMLEFTKNVGAKGSNEDKISSLIAEGYRYVPGRNHDLSKTRGGRKNTKDRYDSTDGFYVPAAVHQEALARLDGDRSLPDWFDHSKDSYKKLIDSLMVEHLQGNANYLEASSQQDSINKLKAQLTGY